ncbi:MAG: DUF4388 domain-containing protein [Planctomycetota bacterium]
MNLPSRILESMGGLVGDDQGEASKDFEHLLARVQGLVERRAKHTSTKGETRDLLAEVLFSRLNKGFQDFVTSGELVGDARKKADFFVGSILTGTVLEEIAHILDHILMEAVLPRDYHLAGRSDFIRIHELLQLLSSGKHSGRLMFERPDAQLDLYFRNGLISFVDPHQFSQRMIRGKGLSPWREIPEGLCNEANRRRLEHGTPVLLGLKEQGYFKEEEFKNQVRAIGSELIYDALMNYQEASFSYKALDELPEWVVDYNAGLPVMPLLLEGHKRLDDWRMIRKVFPDLDEEIQPAPDLFSRIAELSLGVVEIKVLTIINGGNASFNKVKASVGLQSFDLGMMLVGFAQQGIIDPPGGTDSLSYELSTEESMEAVEEALMANESLDAIPESLDAIFGDEGEEGFGLGFLEAAREDGKKVDKG